MEEVSNVGMTVSRTTCRDDEIGSKNSLTTCKACCVVGDSSISIPTKMRLFMVVPRVPLVHLRLLRHCCIRQRTYHYLRQSITGFRVSGKKLFIQYLQHICLQVINAELVNLEIFLR